MLRPSHRSVCCVFSSSQRSAFSSCKTSSHSSRLAARLPHPVQLRRDRRFSLPDFFIMSNFIALVASRRTASTPFIMSFRFSCLAARVALHVQRHRALLISPHGFLNPGRTSSRLSRLAVRLPREPNVIALLASCRAASSPCRTSWRPSRLAARLPRHVQRHRARRLVARLPRRDQHHCARRVSPSCFSAMSNIIALVASRREDSRPFIS